MGWCENCGEYKYPPPFDTVTRWRPVIGWWSLLPSGAVVPPSPALGLLLKGSVQRSMVQPIIYCWEAFSILKVNDSGVSLVNRESAGSVQYGSGYPHPHRTRTAPAPHPHRLVSPAAADTIMLSWSLRLATTAPGRRK